MNILKLYRAWRRNRILRALNRVDDEIASRCELWRDVLFPVNDGCEALVLRRTRLEKKLQRFV